MRLEGVELRRVRLPLVAPFQTSFATETVRDALLIRAVSEGVEGWGECVAGMEPRYSSEYVDGAQAVITRYLGPALLAEGNLTAETVAQVLAPFTGHRMAKAALEMAVLDVQLRRQRTSLASYLGATVDRVPSGVSVGIQPSLDDLVRVVGGYLDEGYVRIKIKIKPGWDIEPVRVLREAYGESVPLQVDANSAYSLADASIFRQLDAFGLLLIEQPLYEDDIRLHAKLAAMISTPVCLDESIVSARAAADAIALGATSVINIKPGRVGGYLEARRIHDLAVANGVAVWCGGMLETGIGRSANAALAALPGFTLPGDISASSRFYETDITAPVLLENGYVSVPQGPGIGVAPMADQLAAFSTQTAWLASARL
ncbi:MAG TPA: o-succinylbenzoate synthase [Propionibacteriaceae bacterium]